MNTIRKIKGKILSKFGIFYKNYPLVWILAFFVSIRSILEFFSRLRYEWLGPYNWDTPIYWAVGRGLLNGLKPYSDLWETKPPGIFFLSALSLLLTGNVWFLNFFQVIVLIFTAIAPLLFLLFYEKEKRVKSFFPYFVAIVGGIIYALYSAERAGEVQIESFGTAFCVLYALLLAFYDSSEKKIPWFLIIGMAISMLFSIGLKEPFFLITVAIALIFCNSRKDYIMGFVLPLLLGGVLGIVALLVSGIFEPYIKEYLRYMLSSHLNRYGPIWERGFLFGLLWKDMNSFDMGLGTLTLSIFFSYLFVKLKEIKNRFIFQDVKYYLRNLLKNLLRISFFIVKAFLIAYLSMLAVGAAGDFYNHHYAFAIATYVALFIYILRGYINNISFVTKSGILLVLGIMIVCAVVSLPVISYNTRLADIRNHDLYARSEAMYVDKVLDKMNINRYFFIGPLGQQLYGYTKHSPYNPFFQIYDFFYPGNEYFKQMFISNIQKSDIIVFDNYYILDLTNWTQGYINSNFSDIPWPEVSNINRSYKKYTIYFRKK